MTDDHLMARLASLEASMSSGFTSLEDRIETRFQSLERRLLETERTTAVDRIEVARTSTRVSLIIGMVTFFGSLSGSVLAATQLA